MTFLPWDESTPPGTAPARSIASELTKLETQVRERLESIFGISDFRTQVDPIHIARLLMTSIAASYVVGGSTSWAVRNNADNANNLLVGDNGDVTVRKDLTVLGTILSALTFGNNLTVDPGHAVLFKSNTAIQDAQFSTFRKDKGNITGAVTFDWNEGNWQAGTLIANVTPTFTNPVSGARYFLELKQGNLGSYGMTAWPGNVYWPGGVVPTPTTAIGRSDVVELMYDGSDYWGRTWGANYSVP